LGGKFSDLTWKVKLNMERGFGGLKAKGKETKTKQERIATRKLKGGKVFHHW